MRRLVFVLLLTACGGGAASTPNGTTPNGTTPNGTVRADLVCTESGPGAEAECVARGCQWGPPLYCSGVATEPESSRTDVTRPCTCVCDSDRVQCMSQP